MKNITIIFTLMLFLLAPSISTKNSRLGNVGDGVSHSMASCSDVLSCGTSAQQCCASGPASSLYLHAIELSTPLMLPQRSAYFQYHPQTLFGTKSLLYRPPIV